MPQLVPQSDEDAIAAIRLYRTPRIGPKGYFAILDACTSFAEALEYTTDRALKMGVADFALTPKSVAEDEWENGLRFGARWIASGTDDYPKGLESAPDRPPFLWVKGQIEMLASPNLAIIGSRNPTLDGVRMTAQLAKLLSYEGITIVSGLARGIDAVAHESSITLGTIGIVAGGIDVFYPKSNADLQAFMFEAGAVVSEMPLGYEPIARDFPKRNRIIAGLSEAVLVIEASLRSGTKLTVNDALALGRPIMAVPGHPFAGLSALPNQLIREGAYMICSLDDILDAMPHWQKRDKTPTLTPPTNPRPVSDAPSADQSRIDLGRALIEGLAVQEADGTIRMIR